MARNFIGPSKGSIRAGTSLPSRVPPLLFEERGLARSTFDDLLHLPLAIVGTSGGGIASCQSRPRGSLTLSFLAPACVLPGVGVLECDRQGASWHIATGIRGASGPELPPLLPEAVPNVADCATPLGDRAGAPPLGDCAGAPPLGDCAGAPPLDDCAGAPRESGALSGGGIFLHGPGIATTAGCRTVRRDKVSPDSKLRTANRDTGAIPLTAEPKGC